VRAGRRAARAYAGASGELNAGGGAASGRSGHDDPSKNDGAHAALLEDEASAHENTYFVSTRAAKVQFSTLR
jgi:hypothetical protein